MRLAETQAAVASAVVDGARLPSTLRLTGGVDPARRFAVHARHYHTSLARSVVERFPATVWLVGSDFVTAAATAFVREHPPRRPCLAEYGDEFPAFVGSWPAATALPYLEQFAAIEWHLGRMAIAVDEPPVTLRVDWSLDDLFAFFLSEEAPDSYELRAETVWLELRGSRGEISIERRRAEE